MEDQVENKSLNFDNMGIDQRLLKVSYFFISKSITYEQNYIL